MLRRHPCLGESIVPTHTHDSLDGMLHRAQKQPERILQQSVCLTLAQTAISVRRPKQGTLGALLGAILACLCFAFPVCHAQTALVPSSTLLTIDQGTLTLYTTYSHWTGYWSSNITLIAGESCVGLGHLQQTNQCHILQAAELCLASAWRVLLQQLLTA